MLPPEILASFFLASLMLALAPGPDNIFVLIQSARFGSQAGTATSLGLLTGLCFHTTAVALGVAAIVQTSDMAFFLLKSLGAGYLLWLAWSSFHARPASIEAGGAGRMTAPGNGALYVRGILMNVSNPKVAIFFLAFLPQFCNPDKGSLVLQIISLGALFILASFLVFFPIALLGGRLAIWINKSAGIQRFVFRMTGCIFIALAILLLFSSR
jgi:threonine/homoserine/homoserine lactone efflux protein